MTKVSMESAKELINLHLTGGMSKDEIKKTVGYWSALSFEDRDKLIVYIDNLGGAIDHEKREIVEKALNVNLEVIKFYPPYIRDYIELRLSYAKDYIDKGDERSYQGILGCNHIIKKHLGL